MDWFKPAKGVWQGCILSHCSFNLSAEYIMWNVGLDEAQAGRNNDSLRYADDTTFLAESEEEPKSLLIKVKEESEIYSLNLNIQKSMIMASGLITSWQIFGKTMETVTDYIFLVGFKITVDGDCRHEVKRLLSLGRKTTTNLDSILKSRGIAFLTKFSIVKALVFQRKLWKWDLDHKECWSPMNWCFQTVVQKKILENPLDRKEIKLVNPKGNHPWIFIGGTDVKAEDLILDHLIRRANSW